jgi:hypothetical protein
MVSEGCSPPFSPPTSPLTTSHLATSHLATSPLASSHLNATTSVNMKYMEKPNIPTVNGGMSVLIVMLFEEV